MYKIPTVYIVCNKTNSVIYVGVTSNLKRRIWQYKTKYFNKSFSAEYNCSKLVYYTNFPSMKEAMNFEKRLKNWNRSWKENLISKDNYDWKDLSNEWYEGGVLGDSGSSPE